MSVKNIAIFDLDNTITTKDTYLAFLIFCLKKKPLRLIRCYFLPIAVLLFKFKLKDNSWLKKVFLGAIVGGMSRDVVTKIVDEFLLDIQNHYYPEALKQIKQHKEQGDFLILASASYDFYVEKIGKSLGFDQVICTQSVWHDERLMGDINGKNCYGPNKLERVKSALGNIADSQTKIAYSDHHSDRFLLEWADKAVAVNPTEKLRTIAQQGTIEVRTW